jgi:hypothetical protein
MTEQQSMDDPEPAKVVERRRFQFSLKALLFAMIVVSAFLGGMALQKRLDKPTYERQFIPADVGGVHVDVLTMPDGTRWMRGVDSDTPPIE